MCVAEGVGFEPTIRFPVYTLSKRAPSATRPSLRNRGAPIGTHLKSARTIVAGGGVATRSRPPAMVNCRLSIHHPDRAGLADVIAPKLGGALAEGGRAH